MSRGDGEPAAPRFDEIDEGILTFVCGAVDLCCLTDARRAGTRSPRDGKSNVEEAVVVGVRSCHPTDDPDDICDEYDAEGELERIESGVRAMNRVGVLGVL